MQGPNTLVFLKSFEKLTLPWCSDHPKHLCMLCTVSCSMFRTQNQYIQMYKGVTFEPRRNNSHNAMRPKRPKWTNNCAKTNWGCEKPNQSRHLLFGSYLLRVWRAGRHTQITPEVLPGEQTSDSVDSWCPAEAWTRAGPTASVQRDHRRAIQQQLMCGRRASTPPPRPAHKISNFLKYDQVYERCFESGGGGDPPAHLNDSWFNSVRSRAQEVSKSGASRKGRSEEKKNAVRGMEEMCCTQAAVVSVARWNDTRPSTLLRTTVVLWVGTMCVHDALRQVLKPPPGPGGRKGAVTDDNIFRLLKPK